MDRVVVFFFIHTQNKGQILALGWRGDNDLLGSTAHDMRISADLATFALGIGKDASALKNDIHTEIFPGQVARIFFGEDFDFLAIDHQVASFIDMNFTLIDAVIRVKLEEVGVSLWIKEIVDCNDFQRIRSVFEEAL